MTIDAQLIRDDENARTAALDITRSFIVQAPAGSGKTELLIQRYLKLLATVEHPEEVLAITFTTKAAAEMQLRVLQALQKAMCGETSSEPHERITAEAAKAVLERDGQRNWCLVLNPRRMRIKTLDSLNASIVRTQPLTSTSGASGSSIVADGEMRQLYRNAAALTLDQLAESGELRAATEQVLFHVDNNTWLYVDYLARMLATRDQWLPFVGSGLVGQEDSSQLRQQFEQSLVQVIAEHIGGVASAFPREYAPVLLGLADYAAHNLHANGQSDNPICAIDPLEGLPGASADELLRWLGIAELLLTRQGDWRKQVNKNQGFPPEGKEQKRALNDLLESLQDNHEFRSLLQGTRELPPDCYEDEQWSVLLALFRLLPLAVTELKRLFGERGITDHTEVAIGADAALGTADTPGDVALLLDYQLRHLLVDEMQDTSSAQYRMLEALTGGWEDGDGRTLLCVGDPMQSIYRFRNAEVGQFLLAQETGIGNVEMSTLVLRRNFRSGEVLVDWYNEVFPTVLARKNDSRQSAVSYAAAVSVPKLAGQGQCTIHPVIGSSRAAEADRGCAVVLKILQDNPDDNVAVLVRGRTHLPQLLSRFRKAGIAYRAVEIDRLTDLPEIIDILALTRALVHSGDRIAWLALLRSPWLGLDWTDLHALVRNDTRRSVWEILQDDVAIERLSEFGRNAIPHFRSKVVGIMSGNRAGSLRDRIEKGWLTLGGPAILDNPRAVQNVYRYLDVIEKLEVAGSLPDVAELEAALDLEHVSSDADARLQVMTMHRAKGLQFDHVLLFGLGRIPRGRETSVLSWFDIPDEHGRTLKVISPVGPRAELERDPLHRYISSAETAKDQNELGRLLYVACTRARRSLHLLGQAQVLKKGLSPAPRSLLHLLWPTVALAYEAEFDSDAHQPETEIDSGWLMPELRRFNAQWMPPDLAPLPGTTDTVDRGEEQREVEFYWVGAGARFAGTMVHRWIQLLTEGRVETSTEQLDALHPASERWLREMGVGSESIQPIVARVDGALRRLLEDKRGQWLLHGEGYAELALSGIVQGRIESVVLDRVRIDGDGTHWIVD
ncbi:MAG: UvrD-helicase domain-containing protein, partial [Desulfobulbaceae bacterium]|nr:UvrD-helicase domain-containing protein [Desulfobulbaceae bacterium]